MNKNRIVVLLEILIVFGAFLFFTITKAIPQMKEKYGSSDKIINTKRYKNMFEFVIDNNIDFSLIIDKDKNVYHMLFFDKNSVLLYNRGIENNNLGDSLDKVVQILVRNNYLKNDSNITLTRYEDYEYKNFLDRFKKSLNNHSLNNNVIEKKASLTDKSNQLKISEGNDELLMNLDYYSKEIVFKYKNEIGSGDSISQVNSIVFSNNVYKKLEEYVYKNNIKTLDKNNTDFVIYLIPASSDKKYYPSSNSWYYVKNSKIYAYIEFQNNDIRYKHCYRGSIDLVSEGEC